MFILFLNLKPLSFLKKSFGPLGESHDIIFVLLTAASIKTKPGSSHKEHNIKHLHNFKYL